VFAFPEQHFNAEPSSLAPGTAQQESIELMFIEQQLPSAPWSFEPFGTQQTPASLAAEVQHSDFPPVAPFLTQHFDPTRPPPQQSAAFPALDPLAMHVLEADALDAEDECELVLEELVPDEPVPDELVLDDPELELAPPPEPIQNVLSEQTAIFFG
jgi:hypothetical protein